MPRAILNDVVLADSPTTVVVEGNHYFPPESISWDRLESSKTRTVCPWKGLASYHDALLDDGALCDVGWTYKRPFPLARRIRGHVAFGPYVRVEASPTDPPPAPHRGMLTQLRDRFASQQPAHRGEFT